jgi:hypothetical protein
MTSFFALNITVFPQSSQGSNSFTLDYVSKYICKTLPICDYLRLVADDRSVGISAALIVPLVIIAFNVDAVTSLWIVRKMVDGVNAVVRLTLLLLAALAIMPQYSYHKATATIRRLFLRARGEWKTRFPERRKLPKYQPDIEVGETESERAYLEEQKKLGQNNERVVQGVHLQAVQRRGSRTSGD